MLIPALVIVVTLTVSAVAVATMARGGARNGLIVVGLFFLLFSFGPAVNYLLGAPIFAGIDLRYAAPALVGFTLASISLAVVDKVRPLHLGPTLSWGSFRYPLVSILLLGTASYGALVVVTRLLGTVGANKLVQVAAAGPGHYPYLLAQILMCSTYFYCKTRGETRVWRLNFAVYVVYALVTSERDFLFVAASIFVHREFLYDKRRTGRALLLGVVAATTATALASVRTAVRDAGALSSVLNQGSILFIDSQMHRLVPIRIGHYDGRTYLDAVLRPLGLTDAPPLAEWFVSVYSPGNPSGFGFSLTGEAVLNFGIGAVPVVFALLAVVHRALVNRAHRSEAVTFLSVVFLATWLYALRGDSAQIFSTMSYAAVLALGLALTRRAVPPERDTVPARRPGSGKPRAGARPRLAPNGAVPSRRPK